MNTRVGVAAIVVGCAVAFTPAQAPQAKVGKPAAAAPHKGGPKRPEKPSAAKKAVPDAIAKAYAALTEADRLGIQSDLAWVGAYEGPPGGDIGDRVIEAVKAFQKRNAGKETGVLTDAERARLEAAAKSAQNAVGWRSIDDPATAARLGLPEKLVAPNGTTRTGSRWMSGRGQIQVETFRLHEAGLPALFDEEKKTPRQRTIDSSALKPDSFVITGTQGLKNFVVRAQSSGAEVRGITILYDQATAGTMAPVAVAMANAFQGFPDPNAVLPPGQMRGVEYGTAIMADGSGDLIASAAVTAACGDIIVAGFGHAARIAADAASDLALIRLYGARNLVPGPVGSNGEAARGGDLTLIGILGPPTQQGGDGVTKVAAHLDGQAVEPAPAPGFAGAAAIDGQGRLAGTIALKTVAAAAGGGAATMQAVLVPAAALRTFLAAHGVAPVAPGGGFEQSVVRVICVRK